MPSQAYENLQKSQTIKGNTAPPASQNDHVAPLALALRWLADSAFGQPFTHSFRFRFSAAAAAAMTLVKRCACAAAAAASAAA